MNKLQCFYIFALVFLSQTGYVTSHGRLIQPPQRSSAWRFGYDNPINYNDNELFCGGAAVQWNLINDGRCGVCGDPFNVAVKPNEDVNGTYVKNGVITGSYVRGQVMPTKIDITAYHKGWFEFRLCPLSTPTTKVTQACLNQTLLRVAGSNTSRIILKDIIVGSGAGIYEINLQLPSNITCVRCVLQWRYNTGNSWDCDSKGCGIGFGKQENFVNCADIRITDMQTGTTTTQTSSSASQSATMTALTSSTTLQSSTSSATASTFPASATPSTSSATSTSSTTIPQKTNEETTSSSSNSQASLQSSSATEETTASSVTNTDSASASNNSQTTSSSLPSSDTTTTNGDSSTSNNHSQSTSSSPPSSVTTTRNGDTSTSSSNSQSTSTSPPSSVTTTAHGCSSTQLSCTAVFPYSAVPGIAVWCCNNCLRGFCPSSHCSCSNN